MTVSRRDFLLWGTAGSTALALGSAWSQAPANLGTAALPAQGWRQFSLGSEAIDTSKSMRSASEGARPVTCRPWGMRVYSNSSNCSASTGN